MWQDDIDSLVPGRTLNRRGFVGSALGTGFAAAVLPVAAQTVIKTDATGLLAGEVASRWATSRCPPIAPCRRARPMLRWCWW